MNAWRARQERDEEAVLRILDQPHTATVSATLLWVLTSIPPRRVDAAINRLLAAEKIQTTSSYAAPGIILYRRSAHR